MRELKGVAPSLYNPIYPIIRRHDALIFHLISRKERGRELCIGTLRIPLHFKQGKLTITLLQIINLLLLTGTPKIAVYISSSILIRLHSLTNEEVFHKAPTSCRNRVIFAVYRLFFIHNLLCTTFPAPHLSRYFRVFPNLPQVLRPILYPILLLRVIFRVSGDAGQKLFAHCGHGH